jgi:hypothetical protein
MTAMHLKDARTRTDTHLEFFQNQALSDVQCVAPKYLIGLAAN